MASDALGPAHAEPRPDAPHRAGTPAAGAPVAGAPAPNVTELLVAWGAGDAAALDLLMPVVYAELRRQAAREMRREPTGHTLGATALVHEAYLRLVDQSRVAWRDRTQFFAMSAQLMRHLLVDHARAQQTAKRGGGAQRITLGHAADVQAGDPGTEADVLALHEALDGLAALDPDQARLVELRYFGGLTIEETAAVLDVSPATVKREWATARAWLLRELGGR